MSLDYLKIRFIFEYILFTVGIIGVIGNVFVIIIFSRQSLRKYSYSFYCVIMAISDIFFLANIFIDWTSYNFGADLLTVGPVFCKLVSIIPYYFADFSIHLLTIIAIDRMISIVYPKLFLVIKKRWFQSLIVAIMALIVLSTNIIVPIYSNIIEIPLKNSSQTIQACSITAESLIIEMWITIPNFVLVNIIINNWINIKTIRFIMASRRRVNVNAKNRNSSLSSRDRKFAICSICLNLVSMVCKLPFFICLLVVTYANLSFEEIVSIIKITSTITYIENGFSFFVNMLVNSLFYDEFMILFGLRKPPIHHVSTNNSFNSNNSNN